MTASNKPTFVPATDEPMSIAKPGEFNLDRFRATRSATLAGVGTLLTALPHHGIKEANDWVRLHPNEERYWSKAYCFVNVPIQGQTRGMLHLIVEQLAVQHLPSNRIQQFRLALAAVANGGFFLCHVPADNLDNPWNDTNLKACIQAKTLWTQATSRRKEGVDGYKIDFSKDPDAFPEPAWPAQGIDELISVTFANRMIDREDHPGLLRLIGAKQSIS